MTKDHFKSMDYWAMEIALLEAQKAYESGEVPVGATLLIDGKLIAKAYNQVEKI